LVLGLAGARNPQKAANGQAVSLQAVVNSDPPGNAAPTGTVTFRDGDITLGTAALNGYLAELTVPLSGVGLHAITASYSGDATFAGSTTGTITTIAGNGNSGYSGDHGPATSAQLYGPDDVAMDGLNDLFIADLNNRVVRKVSPDGQIITVAGNGVSGYSGDNGPATKAELVYPDGVAVDQAGNLFIADGSRIREVIAATNTIITVAGDGTYGYSGDGGPATAAEIEYPEGMVVDYSGNLFFVDAGNQVVREVVQATKKIATVAGNGKSGYRGDGGPATGAELSSPSGLAIDSDGDLFISDGTYSVVREVVAPGGNIFTVAGNGTSGYSGDGGPATNAQLHAPDGIAVDYDGNLFIADYSNYVVREVVKSSGTILTIAGGGGFGVEDGVPATASAIDGPVAVEVDSGGNLFIAEYNDSRIRKVTVPAQVAVDPAVTTTLVTAATGSAAFGQDVSFTATVVPQFGGIPTGSVTFRDGSTTLGKVALSGGTATLTTPLTSLGRRSITASYSGDPSFTASATGTISTIGGNGYGGDTGDGGPATGASLSSPAGEAVDPAGNLFLADSLSDGVREVVQATGTIIAVAGTGTAGYSGDNGPATKAELNDPTSVAVDFAGNLFIADSKNNVIREVFKATSTIITFAGNGIPGYSGDGKAATKARLDDPRGVAVDLEGDVFIADSGNNVIREVLKSTGTITTVAGDGMAGYSGDKGPATKAQLDYPTSVAVDQAGDFFIADTYNQVIREVLKATGTITTVAGNGTPGYSGDKGPATQAQLDYPASVAVDQAGDVFIADLNNQVVREVIAADKTIVTVAGDGTSDFGGDGGPAANARLTDPAGVAVHPAGDLFIADQGNERIREVTAAARVVVNPDATTTSIMSSSTSAAFGQAVTFTATVTAAKPGVGTPGGSVVFSIDGGAVVVPLNPRGQAEWTTAALEIGSHTVTAAYQAGIGYLASQAGSVRQLVVAANTETILIPQAVRKGRGKLVALNLAARIDPQAPGGGVPAGTVTYFANGRIIGTAALSGGTAVITVKPNRVLKKAITIQYSGEAHFHASTSSKMVLSQRALRSLVRPLTTFLSREIG
jgi:sugar lactone lactonase YvrE